MRMDIYKYFSNDYELMDINGARKIDAFLEDIANGRRKYCKPLQAVFMHKTNHEMFLVLDCLNFNLETIKSVCEEWENNVLKFVNFESEFNNEMGYLKYNIFLVILCKNNTEHEDDDNFRFQTEKSLKICRKIFLLCDDKGQIVEEDKTIIPFYFEPLEVVNNSQTQKLEKELMNLLPNDPAMLSICNKKELISEDVEKMCGWLNENDNN